MFKKLTLFLAIVVTSSLNVSGERTISQTPVSSLDTNELWIWDNSHSLLSHRAMITPLLLWSRIKQLKIQQITVSVPTCSTFYNFLVRIKHITFERDGHGDWISCNNLVWFLLPCSYSWHGLCRQTLQHPHLHFTTFPQFLFFSFFFYPSNLFTFSTFPLFLFFSFSFSLFPLSFPLFLL